MISQEAAREAAPEIFQIMKDADEIEAPEEGKPWPLTIGSDAGNAVLALTVQAFTAPLAADFVDDLVQAALPGVEAVQWRVERIDLVPEYLASQGLPIVEAKGGENDGGVMVS